MLRQLRNPSVPPSLRKALERRSNRTAYWITGGSLLGVGLLVSTLFYLVVSGSSPVVEITKVHHASQISAHGNPVFEVLVDWRNVGKSDVTAVFANISLIGEDGAVLDSVPDYCIYDGYLRPGERFIERPGDGYWFLMSPEEAAGISKIDVTISRWKSGPVVAIE